MRRICDIDFLSMLEHCSNKESKETLSYIIEMYDENERLVDEYSALRRDMYRFRDYENLNNALKMELTVKMRSLKSHQSLINTNWNMILMRLFKINQTLEYKVRVVSDVPKGIEVPEINDALVRIKNEVDEKGIKKWYSQMVAPVVLPPLEQATPEMYAEIRAKRDGLKDYLRQILFEIDEEEMNALVVREVTEQEVAYAIRDVAGPKLVAAPLEIHSTSTDVRTGLKVNSYCRKPLQTSYIDDMCLMRFKCVKCEKNCSDFMMRERLVVKDPERMVCRECARDPAIYHDDPWRMLVPSVTFTLDDVFQTYDLFSKISLHCGRFVTMMCVSKRWKSLQKQMVYDKRIPRFYYTDAQKDFNEQASSSNDVDFDTDENSMECNVLRFIELPVDFFRVYGELKTITLNECTCEDWKIKINLIYVLGPSRFDLNCLVLDYYHPGELKPIIHLLPWDDNCRTDRSTKVFYCYFNSVIDDYLMEVCFIPKSRLVDYKDKNLFRYNQFITTVSELDIYSRQFWWYDKVKFGKFIKLCSQNYHDLIDLMRDGRRDEGGVGAMDLAIC